ncbi:hypothetical protein [uncultured Vibrio sp.]|uniref:hypothetical protein n=1 Tax=uncultured Vibrio sp. TaxID=114054 RepID=UPI0025D725E8|nr:hypothetical protein [uncultured Vibrio sp.]
MEKYCPHCMTELVDRANVHICPRHAIGECSYDAYQLYLDAHTENTLTERRASLSLESQLK